MENQTKTMLEKEVFIEEWDWDQEEKTFIEEMSADRFQRLKTSMNQASTYRTIFTWTKYAIFIVFLTANIGKMYHFPVQGIIVQILLILTGIVCIFSFIKLKKAEGNRDYYRLFLD